MSCPAFIAQSLAVRTATHLLHLSAGTYAHHIALGEFYEALTDLTDKYAEIYLGGTLSMPSFPALVPPRGTPTGVLTGYLADVREEMKGDDESQALMNVLAELEELTLRTLYKLKYLK